MLLKPPSTIPANTTFQGLGANYTPDASGNYSVTNGQDIRYMILNGFTPLEQAVPTDLVTAIVNIAPSATANTAGTASVVSPAGDFTKLAPLSMDLVSTVLGTETLTAKVQANHSDATNSVSNFTITTNTTTVLTLAQLRALFKSNTSIANLSITLQSNIANSTALLAVNSHLLQA